MLVTIVAVKHQKPFIQLTAQKPPAGSTQISSKDLTTEDGISCYRLIITDLKCCLINTTSS